MMRKGLPILLLMLPLFFGGCANPIPEYTRPEAPVPAAWPQGAAYKEPASADNAPAAVDLPWRRFFTDAKLQTVIETALRNNRDLRLAALNVEKARALYRIQRAELLPSVDGSATGLRQRTPADLTSIGRAVTGEQYTVSAGVSAWEIDFFGHLRSLAESSLQDYFGSEHACRSARILLLSEVATAYLTLGADRENLALARSTLEAQQASYHVIRRRFEVGIVPELDVQQAQTRVDSARVDVARYITLVAVDRNALDLLVGSPVPDDLLPDVLNTIEPLPDVSAGLSSETLLNRPDILQAESALKAGNANIGAARAALFPRITLTSAIGTASADLSGLFKSGSLAWNYAPQVVLPIFDARLWGALKATKVQREILVTQYEQSIQSAFREVADALARRGTLGDQLAAQQSLVDASARSFQLATSRYEKGSDIYLNVLDAQRSLYSAQQGLISIQFSKQVNQVDLYRVLGGGLAE